MVPGGMRGMLHGSAAGMGYMSPAFASNAYLANQAAAANHPLVRFIPSLSLPLPSPLTSACLQLHLRTDICPQPKEARPLSHALTSD
jgi:hypothetical protein